MYVHDVLLFYQVRSEMVVRDQEAEEIKNHERKKKEEKEKKRAISVSEEGSIKSKLGQHSNVTLLL